MRCARPNDEASHRQSISRRLHTIDYFLESENESRKWPELYAYICNTRKAYQADATMYAWNTLAEKDGQPQQV